MTTPRRDFTPYVGRVASDDAVLREASATLERAGHVLAIVNVPSGTPVATCRKAGCNALWRLGYHVRRDAPVVLVWDGPSPYLSCPYHAR